MKILNPNRPLDKLRGFQLEQRKSGLMYAGTRLFNPYRHFGQHTIWPRDIGNKKTQHTGNDNFERHV